MIYAWVNVPQPWVERTKLTIDIYNMIPVYWGLGRLGLLIIYCYFCSCAYMETGTSRLTWIPVEATFVHINAYVPVHRDEVKWNLKRRLTKGKPPKKKAKRNNIRWDAIYANKISFRFIDKLLSTFPRFFEWNRQIPVTRDIQVYRDHT